ncbi:MAG: helix-turn-helix transcriptional regulator [Caulobacteraceae bacterium]
MPASGRAKEAVAPADAPSLRPRMRECLGWVAQGKSSVDIGHILGLSPRTVDEHVRNACRVFGVRTRVQAVARALELGWLDPP